MISVEEAREKMLTIESPRIKKERKLIEEKINAAIEDGNSYCFLDFIPSQATIHWVKDYGYMIRIIDDPQPDMIYIVTW